MTGKAPKQFEEYILNNSGAKKVQRDGLRVSNFIHNK